MARNKKKEAEGLLSHPIIFRVTGREYKRLEDIQKKSDCHSIGEVIRRALTGRQIKLFHKDASLDGVVEELAGVREELRAIGVNINQITRHFNASPGGAKRVFLAHQALAQYQLVGQKVNLLLSLISQLARKW
ncbi:mobilization protein MobC [Pontibacter ummariensis]|uniref:Mobilisation protein (MobC) n=1 Tax=Pontibacter ummariensis TaxID=1610492 RepID=A0A239LDX6_9BACT|nr:plasmid mobilization relaxosome protein MobC [Pontibacter ummariensis]PRY03641.1 mobilization protein MobC [Pontibacter ummariensis]SNT28837.1 mobilisation protein (MobC) [Pontibacter ummariensis]